MVGRVGLEPTTRDLKDRRSACLSYLPEGQAPRLSHKGAGAPGDVQASSDLVPERMPSFYRSAKSTARGHAMHWFGSRHDDAEPWPDARETARAEADQRRRGEKREHRYDNENWFPMLSLVAGSLVLLAFAAAKHG